MVESESVFGLIRRQKFHADNIRVILYVNSRYDSVRLLPEVSMKKQLEARLMAIESDKSLS